MMSFIISTRLDPQTLRMLDRVRGKTTRSLAIKELLTLGIRARHQFTPDGTTPNLCFECFATADSIVHLSFQEQDSVANLNFFYDAAVVDKHEVG